MNMKLVLLPGMDGTGNLFADFVKALPPEFKTVIVRYPADFCLSYPELMGIVRSASPDSEPFVLLAESFSTPLAIQYAATNSSYLKGLVLCAGFATSPVRGWRRFVCSLLSPVVFSLPLSEFVIEFMLLGRGAHRSLISSVQVAIRSVRPKVLLARFRAVLGCDVRAELSKITLPILYVMGKEDRLVPASCLEEIQRVNRRTTVAEVSGPHLILQREPLQTAEEVTRFVQGIA
jgi:pimeloyl-ACP methyl ester carboxylesterase